MRLLPTLLGVAALITATAAPAQADPGVEGAPPVDDSAFLTTLQQAGISYGDPQQAIVAANAVCGMVGNGKSGLEVLRGLMNANPGFTTDGAAQFAAIAANTYCPDQLASSSGGSK